MQNLIISILGRKGSGKSHLVAEIIREFRRVIIIDTMGEYAQKLGKRKVKVASTREQAITEIMNASDRRAFIIACQLERESDNMDVLKLVYDTPKVLVVVEETSMFCSPNYLPPPMARLIRFGRHREIDQIYVSRRPAEVHREITAQSDIIISFVQHEPADIKYLRAVMGPRAERLPELPQYGVMVSGEIDRAPVAVLERILATPKRFRLTGESEKR